MILHRVGVMLGDRTGRPLERWDNKVDTLDFSYNTRGAEVCNIFVKMTFDRAMYWYRYGEVLTLTVASSDGIVWRGRIEDINVTNNGLRLVAYGFYSASKDLTDVLFVAKSSFQDFFVMENAWGDYYKPERWEFESAEDGDSITIMPKKDEVHYENVFGAMGFRLPDKCRNEVVTLSFDYVASVPAGWRIEGYITDTSYNEDTNNVKYTMFSVLSTGVLLSAGLTVTPTPLGGGMRHLFVFFRLFFDDPTPTLYAGETGESYLRINGINILGELADNLANPPTPQAVVHDLITWANSINPLDVRAHYTHIDYTDAPIIADLVFEDTTVDEMMETLAAIPETPYEEGANLNREWYFRPKGITSRIFFAQVEDYDIERVLETMTNSIYGVYQLQDNSGWTRRSRTYTDNISVSRFKLTRLTKQDIQGYEAEVIPELLEEKGTTVPRAGFSISHIYTRDGAEVPLHLLRPNDIIRLRNLVTVPTQTFERESVFVVSTMSYDAIGNVLSVELEIPLPKIETMIAKALGR